MLPGIIGTMVKSKIFGGGLKGALSDEDKSKPINRAVNDTFGGALASNTENDALSSIGGSVIPPAAKVATRSSVNSKMPVEELLGVMIEHLDSINENLKTRIEFDKNVEKVKSSNSRETIIESANDHLSVGALRRKEWRGDAGEKIKNAGSSLLSPLLKIGALLLAIKALTLTKEDIDWISDKIATVTKIASNINAVGQAGAELLTLLEKGEWKKSAAWVGGKLSELGNYLEPEGLFNVRKPNAADVAKRETESIKRQNRVLDGKTWIQSEPGLFNIVKPGEKLPHQKDAEKAKKKEDVVMNAPQSAYDIVFGNGKYTSPQSTFNKKLTNLTIEEVLQFQDTLLAVTQQKAKEKGGEKLDKRGHSPVGAYQFTKATIQTIAPAALGKDWKKLKFDKGTQDILGEYYWNQNRNNADVATMTWAALPDNVDYRGMPFSKAKNMIISHEVGNYVGMKPQRTIENKSPSATKVTEEENPEEETPSVADMLRKGLAPLKGLAKTDSTYKPATIEAPDNTKYLDLYKKNMEMETNAIKGMMKKETTNDQGAGPLDIPSVIRSINGGSLDVINPNYKTDDKNIVTGYIRFFGFAK